MHFFRLGLLIGVGVLCSIDGHTQENEHPIELPDSLLTFGDSLSIFNLIDSLIQLREAERSSVSVRLGYNSNVLSAGRTLGIDNFGLSPGISYYHKSGLYADALAYWSNDFEPKLYLVTVSAGYLFIPSDKFSVIAGYDHYFYTASDDEWFIPYTNTLSVSPYLLLKPVGLRLDYSFYFGEQTAHRLTPAVSLTFAKKGWLGIDRIATYPTFSLLFGNETITEIRFPVTLQEWIEARHKQSLGLPWYKVIEKNEFGLMNYGFTLPLSISEGKWNFYFSYTYSIPKALPGEPLALDNSSYVSASITYFLRSGVK